MSDIVSPLLQWLNANPEWASVATFIISAAESVAIIGTIVPGSITMTAIGTLAGAGIIPLWATLFWAILGAVLGDGISYWIGHHYKDRLHQLWPFRNNPSILEKGEIFVNKYGVMSVFIGRFVGPVRALVPLVAGMFGMKPLQFYISNITSAIGWAPIYMLPGILLGAASLELPPDIAMHVILVLLLMTLFTVLCVWSLVKLLQLIHQQTNELQDWTWKKMEGSRFFYPITVMLRHHNPEKIRSQMRLAILFIITSVMFGCLAIYVKMNGAGNLMVNDAIFHLFRGVRNPMIDTIMLNITLLGQKEVVLPVVVALFAWLIYCQRWRPAFHILALGVLAAGGVFITKHLIQSLRPWGIAASPETFSMPSGHTTLATILFMGLAFIFASSVKQSRRWLFYTLATLIVLAVGISRLYLGAHWFTDVLGGWLLSSALLMLVIISYQREPEQPLGSLGIFFVTLLTMICTFSIYHHQHFERMQINYAQQISPSSTTTMKDWWQQDGTLPAYRASLFGFPSQPINIEWVGSFDQIKSTLIKSGWSKPPVRDWVSTLHRIADISSTQYLPLVSPQYLDQKPALILTRNANGMKKLLVLRLWATNCTIAGTGEPIWVGIVGVIPRTYSWLFRKNDLPTEIESGFVFPGRKSTPLWEWKTVIINSPDGTASLMNHKILLIRNKP